MSATVNLQLEPPKCKSNPLSTICISYYLKKYCINNKLSEFEWRTGGN